MAVDESNNHDEMVETSSPKEFTTNAVRPEGCFNVGMGFVSKFTEKSSFPYYLAKYTSTFC